MAASLSAVSPVPVVKVTTAGGAAVARAAVRASDWGPEGFVFLYAFDYNSGFQRKNPLGAVAAFQRAFEPGEGPSLVLKCIGQRAPPRAATRSCWTPSPTVRTCTSSTGPFRAPSATP